MTEQRIKEQKIIGMVRKLSGLLIKNKFTIEGWVCGYDSEIRGIIWIHDANRHRIIVANPYTWFVITYINKLNVETVLDTIDMEEFYNDIIEDRITMDDLVNHYIKIMTFTLKNMNKKIIKNKNV